MSWYPSGYLLNTEHLVHAIFDKDSSENKLLMKAAMGEIELFAKSKSWNEVLWLITNTLKEDGKSIYSCLLYTSPSPRDATLSRMPSSA